MGGVNFFIEKFSPLLIRFVIASLKTRLEELIITFNLFSFGVLCTCSGVAEVSLSVKLFVEIFSEFAVLLLALLLLELDKFSTFVAGVHLEKWAWPFPAFVPLAKR